MEYHADRDALTYPRSLLAAGAPLLEWLGAAAIRWYRAQSDPSGPIMNFIRPDEDLAAAMKDDGAAGQCVTPGLSTFHALNIALDRYAHVATRSRKRRVLDLRPGLGFGADILGPAVRRIDGITDSAFHRRLAARLGRRLFEGPPERDYDLVIALAVDPDEAEEWLASARAFAGADGAVMLTVAGDVADAYRARATVAEQLIGPVADYSRRLPETLLWFEPRIVARASQRPAPPHVPATVRTPLSVLFSLRATARDYPGGDSNQVYRTAEALRARGHRVDVTLEDEPDAGGYDIVHLTNMTIPEETLRVAKAVATSARAVVLMPIFMDHADEGVWGFNCTLWLYAFAKDDDDLGTYLERVKRRTLGLKRPEGLGSYAPPPLRSDMEPGYTAYQIELLRHCDYLIANAYSEVHRIYRYIDSSLPFSIVPTCTDGALYGPQARERFVSRYNLDDFVLMTGRFESRKNQLTVAHHLRDAKYQVVMVGRNQFPPYGDLFRMFWPRNVTVFRHMPEEDLAGAVAAARVLAIPSWDEVVSLTSLNGAISETSMVLTRNGYEHEYFGDDAHYCDPGDANDIVRAIDLAWSQHEKRRERRRALAQRVRSGYTWERAAELTEAAYQRVMQANPRGEARLARATG
ncbi:MAG: glycosyltransferase [Candidatus Eremiobacteraeota bacterium]|nr:glycosyltransferase [Candidatus Eremiobacteraeota bacterium]